MIIATRTSVAADGLTEANTNFCHRQKCKRSRTGHTAKRRETIPYGSHCDSRGMQTIPYGSHCDSRKNIFPGVSKNEDLFRYSIVKEKGIKEDRKCLYIYR